MIPHDLALALCRYEAIYSSLKPKMTITQFIVMGAVEAGKTHRQAHISEHTGLQQLVVRSIVHALYKKKFVRRTTKKGFKAGRPIVITEAGEKAYEECRAIIARTDAEFFAGWHKPSQLEFMELLSRTALTT